MQDISRKMVRGAAWMVLLRMSDRTIGLISIVILARLLVPSDFGLLAIATAIMAALALLGAFSFDLALIQNPDAERRHYDTVWTIGVIFATLTAAVLLVLADPAARFYDEPRLAPIMQVLALGTFVEGFTNVGVVKFRKEMHFDKEFALLFTKRLSTFVATITLAYLWRDYWALVVGTLTGTIVVVVISYVAQPYRPRFSLAARGELFRFSRWLFINNTFGFLYHRAADFIVAKGAGSEGLGYYSVAYEISNLPSSEIVAPVNRAVFPAYAKLSSDPVLMRQGFLNVISVLALFAVPLAVGLACVATPIVNIVLGPKWTSTIPLIPILAINGVLTAILSCSGYVYVAIGKPRHVTLLLGTHIAMAVPMIAWAALNWELAAVAWALLTASILVVPLNYLLLLTALQITAVDFCRVLWRPAVAAGVMAALLTWGDGVYHVEAEFPGNVIDLLLMVAYGAAIYTGLVLLLWRLSSSPAGAEAFVLRSVKEILSNRRGNFSIGK
jgi:O-antigen/teichoic acid export membrane protein